MKKIIITIALIMITTGVVRADVLDVQPFIFTQWNVIQVKSDNFDDNVLDTQWLFAYSSITGVVFEEIGSELKYSGTPSASGYCAILTAYTNQRYTWMQQLKFRAPTAIATGKEILFRMDCDQNNFVEISIQGDGYRLEKVENGAQPSGSVIGPITLFGNENTIPHTLRLLWDEETHKAYGWVDNKYIGCLAVNVATFPNKQRFSLHINNSSGSVIDRRFDEFIIHN